jgi:NIMA (never in mitosis gene a)-related kinase
MNNININNNNNNNNSTTISDFEILQKLGKGAFGNVYLVKRKADKKIYALKKVIIQKLNKKEQDNSVNEVRILASISHPNVIGYKEAFWEDSTQSLNIVMEYADDGDLSQKIAQNQKISKHFPERTIWSYSIQMVEGLKALHDKQIMHRDLKSANIFLLKNGLCKLGDLNVSKVIKNPNKLLYTQTGTPFYASPEVWRDEPYSYKSDLWSIGCVIYELCTFRPPFKGNNMDELFKNVCRGKINKIPGLYSDDVWKMIEMLLQVNSKNRPSCEEFLESKLIKKKIKEMKEDECLFDNKNFDEENNQINLLNTIKFNNIKDL